MNDSPDLPRIDRRRLLNGAAVLGLAAPVLAACGDDEEPAASTTTEDTPADAGSPSASGDNGSGSDGFLVGTADVPVGGGVILDDQKVVVTQPDEGDFKAFTAVCTHQGCVVATIEDGTINCPCHGSKFSTEDGSVVTGPATGPLTAVDVKVMGSKVVRT